MCEGLLLKKSRKYEKLSREKDLAFRFKFFFAIRKIPERQFSKKGEKFCKTQGKKMFI
jgi:hypothetical protein